MSFILDAIAKSEQERQQLDVPRAEVLAIPMANAQPRHLLPYFVVGALLLNAIVFTIWVQSDSPLELTAVEEKNLIEHTDIIVGAEPDSSQFVQQRTPISVMENIPVVDNTTAEIVSETEITTDNAAADKGGKSTEVINSEPEGVLSETIASVTEGETDGWVRIEPDSLLKNTKKGLDAETSGLQTPNPDSKQLTVSRLYDLPEGVRNNLPRVKFSGHLYSSDPATSVVFLDNQRPVMQGQQIADDLFLHEITPSGVVVEFRGYLIDVGVLQNWTLN